MNHLTTLIDPVPADLSSRYPGGHEGGRIVVDLSDPFTGAPTLRWAAAAAVQHGCEIEVVSVVRPSVLTLDPVSIGWACGMEDEALEWMRGWQRRFVTETLGAGGAEFVVAWHVSAGDPVRELVRIASGARCLVVARPPRRPWFGRTRAERCARRLACAVVEVPAAATDTEAERSVSAR